MWSEFVCSHSHTHTHTHTQTWLLCQSLFNGRCYSAWSCCSKGDKGVYLCVCVCEGERDVVDRDNSSLGAFGWMKSPRSSVLCWANCTFCTRSLLEGERSLQVPPRLALMSWYLHCEKDKPARYMHAHAHTHPVAGVCQLPPAAETGRCMRWKQGRKGKEQGVLDAALNDWPKTLNLDYD